MAGRMLGALEGGGGGYLPPFKCIPGDVRGVPAESVESAGWGGGRASHYYCSTMLPC